MKTRKTKLQLSTATLAAEHPLPARTRDAGRKTPQTLGAGRGERPDGARTRGSARERNGRVGGAAAKLKQAPCRATPGGRVGVGPGRSASSGGRGLRVTGRKRNETGLTAGPERCASGKGAGSGERPVPRPDCEEGNQKLVPKSGRRSGAVLGVSVPALCYQDFSSGFGTCLVHPSGFLPALSYYV